MYINAGAFAIGCTISWALKDAERPYSKWLRRNTAFCFSVFCIYIYGIDNRLSCSGMFRFPLCNYASRFKGYNLSQPLFGRSAPLTLSRIAPIFRSKGTKDFIIPCTFVVENEGIALFIVKNTILICERMLILSMLD